MKWYCVQSKPKMESFAQTQLERQGFATLLPVYCKVMHKKEVNMPLFPSYLFVNFNIEDTRWRAIHSTFGVKRLISASPEYPIPIPEKQITEMLNNNKNETSLVPNFELGKIVRVCSGPLWGYQGIVEFSDRDRVRVLLSIFGRSVGVNFNNPTVELERM